MCDQCWKNESKCTNSNFEQKKKKKTLIWVEFEVFTKMISLRPHLAIPMLQIIIKHLKVSSFVCFLYSLLALTLIRSDHIKTDGVLSWYKYTQIYSWLITFKYLHKHNLLSVSYTLYYLFFLLECLCLDVKWKQRNTLYTLVSLL